MASWRHIFFLLSFLGLFSACVILAMLFWMTGQLEKTEHQKTHELIELKLSETTQALGLAVEDYAFWTFAHQLVEANDDDGVFEHIGSGATDSQLFDQIFIIEPGGGLKYAFDEFAGAGAGSLFDERAFAPIWAALNETNAVDYETVASFLNRDGQFSFVVAAWITPDAVVKAPDEPYAAMFGVTHLDQQMLGKLIRQSDISSFDLTPYTPNTQTGSQSDRLEISDLNGVPVAVLAWNLNSLGVSLREKLLPSFVLIALCILAVCGSAARYFRQQYIALGQANLVATTDQLTGVLNRAGLADVLRRKDVLGHLDQGHLAAIYLDLNKFKTLNDTLGHHAGDIALRVTAERLQSAVRKSDIVARLGGDEFICVIIDPDPEVAALSVAKRVLSLATTPVSFDDTQQLVTPSVGLAVSAPGTAWETVLSHADAAMYWAKQKNAEYPVVFCKSMSG